MNTKKAMKIALDFLEENEVTVLSTVSQDGKPEASLVYYSIENTGGNNLKIYIETYKESRKYENLKSNKNVSLVVGTENEPVTLQIEGKAVKVKNKDERKEEISNIAAISVIGKFEPPLITLGKVNMVVFEIEINWMRLLDLRKKVENPDFIQLIEGGVYNE